jgi:hypothetical protein
MKKELMNLFIFIGICFLVYLVFRNIKTLKLSEGMTSSSDSSSTSTSVTNGVAGNASAYAANVKTASIKLQDTLLISKYRSDYENAILNLDDFINNTMLQTALNTDLTNPQSSITQLSNLNQAKTALNSIIKFIDSN